MEKQKKSICRICGREFTPAWKHPEQTVCYDEACRRKATTERVAKFAKKEKATARGRKKYAAREQKRYRDKKAASLSAGHEIAPLTTSSASRLTLRVLHEEFCKLQYAFYGLLQIINENSGWQLSYEKCYEAGKEKFRIMEQRDNIE